MQVGILFRIELDNVGLCLSFDLGHDSSGDCDCISMGIIAEDSSLDVGH